jgi:CTP:molybdopterin cytidylyltransferase MocA
MSDPIPPGTSAPGTDHVIVLASGRGTRAGGPKALHKVGNEAWWQVQGRRLARTGLPVRWVVSETVAQAMHGSDLRMVPGDEAAPMFASIMAGIESIDSDALHRTRDPERVRGVFVLPVDVPAPQPATFRRLSDAMAGSQTLRAAIPTHGGEHGHPIYLPWRCVRERLLGRAHSPDDRLDRMIEGSRLEVPVDDPAVLMNLNTAADFAALPAREWGA